MKKVVIEFNGNETEYNSFIEYVRSKPYVMQIVEEDMTETTVRIKELEIDRRNRQVILKKRQINLTSREFDILSFLALHPGQVFSHRQIYEAVWKKEYFKDIANITAHIGHIRKKIEPNPGKPIYILTVHGIGYRFAENCCKSIRKG